MKLYTKTGDDGTTGLFGGIRVRKDDARVEAYGTVDELNAWIGVVRSGMNGGAVCDGLGVIQTDLFSLGAELATPDASRVPSCITDDAIKRIEAWIDRTDAALPPLKTFILPGGSESAAHLHYARTVCRRAERAAVTLRKLEDLRPQVVVYLNRIGDLLFALAREANHDAGVDDVAWVAPRTE